ncbi:MAG: hypothetical protein BGP24_09605 [Lysobacterales bacterium 69-70]|nr:ATP-binding protein [Xanthomonadaceae bacterium]ODU33212.1 MAG: hypothetical protein ABS97_12630 [Xanthomonadaceae bacterium SCN 69-320]ODV20461.1 MAG: hypothetical protein ABT27_07040 [Xanthomonadaceae bacterium SCN 69-25]OJZ00757.1 MAG: hypothetical protein BGP24_09605 [Xanthomonadales bacterium 69-70]
MTRPIPKLDLDALKAIHASTHPLHTGMDFTLLTPPMKMSWEVVKDDLRLGRTSCIQIASPRYGKTEASRHVAARLAEEFPTAFVLWFDAQYYRETLPSDKRFFGDLLVSAGHSLAAAHEAERRKSRLIEYLWTSATELAGQRVILIIDEIQEMKPAHWRWLRDVWNALKRRGIKTQVVGFGQMQVLTVKNALKVAGEEGLISRFLSHVIVFQGLTTVEDFEEVGAAFDAELQHPVNSGLSYTQFRLPRAFSQGFRLRDQGSAVHTAFAQATPTGDLNVGMEWAMLAYRAYLMEAEDGDPPQHVDDRAWRTAVETARYTESLSFATQ